MDLILKNARVADRETMFDIGILDGRIAALAPTLRPMGGSSTWPGGWPFPG
ncbi:MAG: hypothetical protein WDO24_03305 [Pseudomonadota bacterium]